MGTPKVKAFRALQQMETKTTPGMTEHEAELYSHNYDECFELVEWLAI